MRLARQAIFALSFAPAFALAACNSGQNINGESAAASSHTASSATAIGHYHAELALDGKPKVTADGNDIVVTVNVTNDGSGTFGSMTEPHNVNLAAHSIDATGKIVDNDLARGHLSQVGPGATVKATILLPVAKALGHRAELLPVQEQVGWFDQWGTKPLVVGPFQACSSNATGKVCDASGKPLPPVAPV